MLEQGRPHIPSADDPWVQAQLDVLRARLPGEDDLFLLCYGLVVPGLHRAMNPPLLALAQGFPEPRQRQAVAQISRLREALAQGRAELADLALDTSTALAELQRRLP